MKALKLTIAAFGAFFAVLLIISFFLSSHYEVKRTISIKSPIDSIEYKILNLKEWPNWTVWNAKNDTTMKISFGAKTYGVGSTMKWKGELMGNGELALLTYQPGKYIDYSMNLMNDGFKINGRFLFDIKNDVTTVTWIDSGDLGSNPLNKYFSLIVDGFFGKDLENSLSTLKHSLEKK